ncbi:MAG: efflux RND transporter periplasmic adaptor subunit [Rhodoferax sp.]
MKWTAAAVAVATLAGGGVRLLQARQLKQQTLQAQQDAQATAVALQLSGRDLVEVRPLPLPLQVEVSGAFKAVESAFVKARVAGELQGLQLREGDSVRAGEVVARIEPLEFQARLKQVQQQAEAAKAQVDIAQRSYDNNRSLVEQGFISRTALDTSAANLANAQANHRAAQAAVEVAAKALDDAVLRAPLSGQVAQRLAQPGERVGVEARVLEIINPNRLELEAALNPADSLKVRTGQSARLFIEGSTEAVAARVVRVNPSASAASRTVTAYLAIEPRAGVRQGLFAQGVVELGTQDSLALPLSAVRTDKPQPYVQVLQGGKVQHASVEVLRRAQYQGQAYAAIRGVDQGTQVLVGSLGAVRAGTDAKVAQTGQ